jgi:hypothetical protein
MKGLYSRARIMLLRVVSLLYQKHAREGGDGAMARVDGFGKVDRSRPRSTVQT